MRFARIQSPSSINTYRQCPRRYYYQYILRLPTRPSIHLVRGRITHSVLEDFFKVDAKALSETNYDFELKIVLHELLSRHWTSSKEELASLGLAEHEVSRYLNETKDMLQFWLIDFLAKLRSFPGTVAEAFSALRPATEQHFCSQAYGVQGFVDAIYRTNDEVRIVDYKTSSHDEINDSYRLQLAIYALLYHEKHGEPPHKVGIHFLKFSEKYLDVDEQLVELARRECQEIHRNTQTRNIDDYPKKESGLCKWSSGQCDFYDECSKS